MSTDFLAAILERDAAALTDGGLRAPEDSWSRTAEDRRFLIGLVLALADALDSVGECHGCIRHGHPEAEALLQRINHALSPMAMKP